MDFEDLLERAIERVRRRARRSPSSASGTTRSRSTSTRTSTCSSRRCSSGGSARATTSASSATTTSRSTGSPARRPSTCCGSGSAREVFRLEENYRSTPQVLALANRLVPKLGGAEKTLRATRPDGPEPEVKPFPTAEAEAAHLVERIRAAGCAFEEIALLCRTHARLADFEAVLHEAGIPSQGAALLTREAARRLLRVLDDATPAAERVRAIALDLGWLPFRPPDDKLGEREETRQTRPRPARPAGRGARRDRGGVPGGARAAVRRRRRGAARRAPAHLPRREGARVRGRAAAAAGGEGAAVEAGEDAEAEIADERRLFYVGLTRAKRLLTVTWVGEAEPVPDRADRRDCPRVVARRCPRASRR